MNYGQSIRTAGLLFGIMFLLTGLVYPLFLTGVAEIAFPYQAHGSLVRDKGGMVIGSEIIGQNWTGPSFLRGVPPQLPVLLTMQPDPEDRTSVRQILHCGKR